MASEFDTPTAKTILDHIEVNIDMVDANIVKDTHTDISVETTVGKGGDKQHCKIPAPTIQTAEKHCEENCSEKQILIEKDVKCSVLDISNDKSGSPFVENKLLNSNQLVGMEFDSLPDNRNSMSTVSHQICAKPDKTMKDYKVSNAAEVFEVKESKETFSEHCSVCIDNKGTTIEKNNLSEVIDMSSRSILDVCDMGMVPECSSVEEEGSFNQHFESKADTNEKTILDHTNYVCNTELQCSDEKVKGQNCDIFLCSEKTADNQPCKQKVAPFICSDLAVEKVSSVESIQVREQSFPASEAYYNYEGIASNQVNYKQKCEPVGSNDINSKQTCEPLVSNNVHSNQTPAVQLGQNCLQTGLCGIGVEVPMETDCETVDLCSSDRPYSGGKTSIEDKSLDKHCVTYVSNERSKPDVYDLDTDADDGATHNLSLHTHRKDQKQRENEPILKSVVHNHGNLAGDNLHSDQNKQTITTHDHDDNSESVSIPGSNNLKGLNKQENLSKDLKLTQNVTKGCKSRFKVAYVYNKDLVQICDQMQKIPNRASMVHSLINSYGMTRYMRIVEPRKASDEEVKAFHDPDYLEFLKKISNNDDAEKFESDATQYGLTYDCPVHQGLYDYATMTTGATIVAAECLIQDSCQVAINWCGGWHHAARDQASGFCYINDIVLGILKLKEKYSKILYVDLDLHHGDGVEDAFSATSKVMTVSFHKYAPGFFPGTGRLEDVGIGKGQYYTVNVPLLDGIRDIEFTPLVCRILKKVKETFQPEAVVCQCGADGLAGDPMESFNLTHKGLGKCGYNFSNTARCWAFLTALTAGKQIPEEIPDHQYLMEYGPDYELDIQPGNRKNHNTAAYLRQIYRTVMNNISKVT